jgi:hypothetical protein
VVPFSCAVFDVLDLMPKENCRWRLISLLSLDMTNFHVYRNTASCKHGESETCF